MMGIEIKCDQCGQTPFALEKGGSDVYCYACYIAAIDESDDKEIIIEVLRARVAELEAWQQDAMLLNEFICERQQDVDPCDRCGPCLERIRWNAKNEKGRG